MNYVHHQKTITDDELIYAAQRSGRSMAAINSLVFKLGYPRSCSLNTALSQVNQNHRPQLKAKLNSNECYTPRSWIDFVVEVFGERISLDVASCETANQVVKAKRFFTWQDDALKQSFAADNIFCQPPFGAALVKGFADKMIADRHLYRQGIFLCNASVNSGWNQRLQNACDAILLPSGRTQFWGEDTPLDDRESPEGNNMYQQMLFYFGPNIEKFLELGSKTGTAYTPYKS